MSVDTNVKGKNLTPYRKLRHDGVQIMITPQLVGMADWMRVVTTGLRGSKLRVEFRGPATDDDACAI